MRRKLSTLCAAVSLLLCVAVCVMWVRTTAFGRLDDFEYVSATSNDGIWFARGRLYVRHMHAAAPWWPPRPRRWTYVASESVYAEPAIDPWLGRRGLGFDFARQPGVTNGSPYAETWVTVPLWAVAAAAAVAPALRLVGRVRRRRRGTAGLCPACGYDLRATPARCPECGRADTIPRP